MQDFFKDIAINGVHPIIVFGILPENGFMVGNTSLEMNRRMGKLADITNDTFETFNMADSWCSAKSVKTHNHMSNIHATQCNHPLAHANHRIELGDLIRSTELRSIELGAIILVERRHLLLQQLPIEQFEVLP